MDVNLNLSQTQNTPTKNSAKGSSTVIPEANKNDVKASNESGLSKLSVSELNKLNSSKLSKLNAAALNKLNASQLSKLNAAQLSKISDAKLKALPASTLAKLSPSKLQSLGIENKNAEKVSISEEGKAASNAQIKAEHSNKL